jgi:CubicO group peptidase (beta-lactamase class C family)
LALFLIEDAAMNVRRCGLLVFLVVGAMVGFGRASFGADGVLAGGEDLSKQVDELFAKWDRPDSPGCAVAIVQRGEVVYSKGFGTANLEYGVSNTPRTVHDVMSMSKMFTCACVAILMDEGKLSPGDELRRFVPEMYAFDESIALKHLIQCKSGLWDQTSLPLLVGWENAPLQFPYREADFFTLLCGQRTLQVKPGTEHRYSGGDYFLLGVIVERITGQSLPEFAKERILRPLGMERTFYEVDPTAVVQERAVGHWKPTGEAWHIWRPTTYWVGGGRLTTCVEDLVRWDQAFSLSKLPRGKYLDELLTEGTLLGNRYCLDADAAIKLANPLAAEDAPPGQYRGVKRRQFTGGAWGMTSGMTQFPDQGLTVICLSNSDDLIAWSMNRRISDLLLADQLQPQVLRPTQRPVSELPAVEVADSELDDKVGTYRPKGGAGAAWSISLHSGSLVLTNHLRQTIPLRTLSSARFDPDSPQFYDTTQFVFSQPVGDARPTFVAEWDEPENRGRLEFERVEIVKPTASELSEYAGEYTCDELALTYRLLVRDGSLWLRIGSRRWEQLDATLRDEFIPHIREPADMRVITFQRGGDGTVNGLAVDYYRVKAVRFAKRGR